MASQETAGSSQAANFEQLASKYAGTAAGRRALLQAAAALFQSGDYAQAQTQFEKYLSIDPTGPLAATAEVGMATCLESQNKADLAAAAYQRVISLFPGSVADAQAELALGRITEQQGKYSEAENHFEAAARGAAGSTIAQEAMLHAADLKVKVSAAAGAAPKPGAANSPAAFTPTSIVQPAVKP
jgi:TolA-binding protein